MQKLSFIEGVISGVDDEEVEVVVTFPLGHDERLRFPLKIVSPGLRKFGVPVTIALNEDKSGLAFQLRQVPPRIGPPTREEWAIEEWLSCDL